MKHEKHEERRSFKTWALRGQRLVTLDATKLYRRREKAMAQGRNSHVPNIGKNNVRLTRSMPAQIIGLHTPAFLGMIKGYNGLLPRNTGRSRGGARVASKGKIIPAHAYCPW